MDHPRGCGEHSVLTSCGSYSLGSSPRMRGAPVAAWLCGSCGRIIPADAGSTYGVPVCPIWWRDHPRGCGEHDTMMIQADTLRGSSPRMRGAPDHARR